MRSTATLQSKLVHGFFEVTVSAKGISGIVEIGSGILLLCFKPETVSNLFVLIASYEALEFSPSTYYFIAFYLLFYGMVNMFLVISLLRGRLWAYPTAIIFFTLFTVYMFVRFLFNYSVILSLFIAYDIFLIVMTWLEYQRVKKQTYGGNIN